MAKKKVTLTKFIEAVRLNGYEKGIGHLFYHDDSKTILYDACAVGQAALNLGVDADDLASSLGGIKDGAWGTLFARVYRLNDGFDLQLTDIAQKLQEELPRKNRTIEVEEHDYSHFTNYQGIKVV